MYYNGDNLSLTKEQKWPAIIDTGSSNFGVPDATFQKLRDKWEKEMLAKGRQAHYKIPGAPTAAPADGQNTGGRPNKPQAKGKAKAAGGSGAASKPPSRASFQPKVTTMSATFGNAVGGQSGFKSSTAQRSAMDRKYGGRTVTRSTKTYFLGSTQ